MHVHKTGILRKGEKFTWFTILTTTKGSRLKMSLHSYLTYVTDEHFKVFLQYTYMILKREWHEKDDFWKKTNLDVKEKYQFQYLRNKNFFRKI